MRGSQKAGHSPRRQESLIHRKKLPDHYVLVGIVQCLPAPNASLHGAADAQTDLGMAVTNLPQHDNGTQPGCGPEHRRDLAVPNACKWIGAATSTLRW